MDHFKDIMLNEGLPALVCTAVILGGMLGLVCIVTCLVGS